MSENVAAPSSLPGIPLAAPGAADVPLGAILREAWERTSGAKGTILLAALSFLFVLLALVLLSLAFPSEDETPSWRLQLAQQIVSALIGTPFTAGLYWIGIRRAVGAPIRARMVFAQFEKIIPLFVLQILVTCLTLIGFLLLILPGLYLVVAYMLAIPLVAERNLGPWQALETSRRAVGRHWFKAAGFVLSLTAINLLGMLAFGIGLVWSVPMSVIAYGIYYRTIFGVGPGTVAEAHARG